MIGNPIFIHDHACCACCGQKTGGKYVVFKPVDADGIERHFTFCKSCIDGEATEDRCKELLRRTLGIEDALLRKQEEELVRTLIDG